MTEYLRKGRASVKYLIVNADDFGLSQGVDEGILRSHREGILTSTTFMVNFPWAAESARRLGEAPGLGVGLHLNLTVGIPVAPREQVPSLVGSDGTFRKDFFHLRWNVRPAEVRVEWESQLRRFLELCGRKPTHLDSHHHVHLYPEFARIAIGLAREYGIPAVRIIRPRDLPWSDAWLNPNPRELIYSRYARLSSRLIEESGLLHCDAAIDIGEDPDPRRLIQLLRDLKPGVTELYCHPGYVDEKLASLTSRVAPRPREVALLTDPEVAGAIQEMGIRLVTFEHLGRGRG